MPATLPEATQQALHLYAKDHRMSLEQARVALLQAQLEHYEGVSGMPLAQALEAICESQGYSEVEEVEAHLLRRALRRARRPHNEGVEERLRGLGYFE